MSLRFSTIGLCLLLFTQTASATLLYGHQGARGLAPENTLPAYRISLKHHVDYVDIDVVMTKDHIVVAHHDLTLNPDHTRNAQGRWIKDDQTKVKDLTFKELQSYDVGRIKPDTLYAKQFPNQQPVDGTHIPSLRQVIAYVKAEATYPVGFQIEIKTNPDWPEASFNPDEITQEIAKILVEEDIIDRAEVQAFDWRCLISLQQINSTIKTAYLTDIELSHSMLDTNAVIAGKWSAGYLLKNYSSIPKMIASLGGKLWDPQDLEVTPALIKEAHALGLKVVSWSWVGEYGPEINTDLTRKVIAMGVDGIISDRPDIAKQLIMETANKKG